MTVSVQKSYNLSTPTHSTFFHIKKKKKKKVNVSLPVCLNYMLSSLNPVEPSAWTQTHGNQHRGGLGEHLAENIAWAIKKE